MFRCGAALMALGVFALSLSGPARAEGKVVMTTYGGGTGKTWRDVFAASFTKDTGIPATVTDTLSPEGQIRAQAGNQQYNTAVMLISDAMNLQKDGLLETFDASELPQVKETPTQKLLRTPDGKYFAVAVYFTYYGIVVNTDLAKPSDFDSWKALSDPKWKGKLAVTRPAIAAGYDITAFSYATGGNESKIDGGVDLFRKFVSNTALTYTSPAHLNQLVSRGEVTAAPFYHSGVWRLLEGGATNLKLVLPKEGALMLPYVSIVPKGAKDRAALVKWLNYIAKADVQLGAVDASGYLPLAPDAVLSPEQEKKFGMPLSELVSKLFIPDWATVAKHRDERVNMVEKILASGR
jgi:putative spermidine/putrescine transport system substrate-binding protein